MLKVLRDLEIAKVRRRYEQGDCPQESASSVEMLENVILALATPPAPNDDLRAAGINAALSVIDTFIEASSLESVRLVAQQVRNTVSAALKESRRG